MREFDAYTADLYHLAGCLAECGVDTVAIECARRGSNQGLK